jgi:hypothetical protein
MISKNIRIWTYSIIRKNSMISSRIGKYSQISRHGRIRKQSRKRNSAR